MRASPSINWLLPLLFVNARGAVGNCVAGKSKHRYGAGIQNQILLGSAVRNADKRTINRHSHSSIIAYHFGAFQFWQNWDIIQPLRNCVIYIASAIWFAYCWWEIRIVLFAATIKYALAFHSFNFMTNYFSRSEGSTMTDKIICNANDFERKMDFIFAPNESRCV